jgi:hypothetical protein
VIGVLFERLDGLHRLLADTVVSVGQFAAGGCWLTRPRWGRSGARCEAPGAAAAAPGRFLGAHSGPGPAPGTPRNQPGRLRGHEAVSWALISLS